MAASLPSCQLRHFLRSQPIASPSISPSPTCVGPLLKPLLFSSTRAPSVISKRLRQLQIPPLRRTLFPSLSHHSKFTAIFCHSFPSSPLVVARMEVEDSEAEAEHDDAVDDEVEQYGEEIELINDELGRNVAAVDLASSPLERNREEKLKLPSLTVKERKELASYAYSLGKKLKTQLVGKSGITPSVASSFIETLEANELLKIKIHGTCPGELDDVVKQLEEATSSVAVSQIGRTVIVYRPSLTKLKAEEKKKQARRVFKRKQPIPKLSKERVPKLSRRGSSWKQ